MVGGTSNSLPRTSSVPAALLLAMVIASLSCGGGNNGTPTTGCYVNGQYYPNGNGANGLCVCLLPGPCNITYPVPAIAMTGLSRHGSTRTQLSHGKVLLTGGEDSSGTVLNTAELYDPVTKTSTAVIGRMTSPPRWTHRDPAPQ